MKTRGLILLLSVMLFSSCIVKSIQPFYVKDTIKFDKRLIGKWTSGKTKSWEIMSFKEQWEKETDPNTKLTKEDKEAFQNYKDGYYIKYTRKNTEATFIAIPFMVDEHLFLDFTPFEYESDDLNPLVAQHLLKTHSAAYVEFSENGIIKLKWLSESAVGKLLRENKLRLKHETTGIDEDLVLTATSEELNEFLKKFMTLEDNSDKWDNDDIYVLKPNDAKP